MNDLSVVNRVILINKVQLEFILKQQIIIAFSKEQGIYLSVIIKEGYHQLKRHQQLCHERQKHLSYKETYWW